MEEEGNRGGYNIIGKLIWIINVISLFACSGTSEAKACREIQGTQGTWTSSYGNVLVYAVGYYWPDLMIICSYNLSGVWQTGGFYREKEKEECCEGPQIHAISTSYWTLKTVAALVLLLLLNCIWSPFYNYWYGHATRFGLWETCCMLAGWQIWWLYYSHLFKGCKRCMVFLVLCLRVAFIWHQNQNSSSFTLM